MKKHEIYLDMSKLTREQQDEIIGMLPEAQLPLQYSPEPSQTALSFHVLFKIWYTGTNELVKIFRTEITYSQFKNLYPTWL